MCCPLHALNPSDHLSSDLFPCNAISVCKYLEFFSKTSLPQNYGWSRREIRFFLAKRICDDHLVSGSIVQNSRAVQPLKPALFALRCVLRCNEWDLQSPWDCNVREIVSPFLTRFLVLVCPHGCRLTDVDGSSIAYGVFTIEIGNQYRYRTTSVNYGHERSSFLSFYLSNSAT